MPNRVCQVNARSGLACGWLIRFSNAIANAFKAGFHPVAHGARPRLAGRGVPVTELGVRGPGIATEPADRRYSVAHLASNSPNRSPGPLRSGRCKRA